METEKVIEALEKAMQKVMPIGQSAFEELVAKTAFSGMIGFIVCLLAFIGWSFCIYYWTRSQIGGSDQGLIPLILAIPALIWCFLAVACELNLVNWLYPKAHVIEQIINRAQ